ncbi:MAG: hypothetical protein V7706_13070 [Dietzia psychralcaliphila]
MFSVLTLALLGTSALAVLAVAPANAAARLNVSSSLGGAVASTSGQTGFTVSGSGFQAVDGGFGGVYIGFGWVNGSGWGPSKGGATGRTYDYVPDEQSRSNQGFQAFVAFPGSSTSGEAQATMGSDGSFRVNLTVPGPTFTGAGGKSIDCTKVTCGFLTWGAHGVRNGANETFTPVTFQGGAPAPAVEEAPSAGAPAANAQAGRSAATGRAATRSRSSVTAQGSAAGTAGSAGQQSPNTAGSGGTDTAAGGDTPTDGAPAAATGGTTTTVTAVIEVDRKAARPGGTMGFAAAGFWPGEQVYVVLGEGDAAVGPVLAGVDGEVAGVLVLPEDIAPGTHEIRAAGAGSGLEAAERFPVRTDISPTASAAGLSASAGWVFLALAALALLAAGAVTVNRRFLARHDSVDGPDAVDGEGGEPLDPSGPGDQSTGPYPHPAMAGGSRQHPTDLEQRDPR